jgi:hypothetical protein
MLGNLMLSGTVDAGGAARQDQLTCISTGRGVRFVHFKDLGQTSGAMPGGQISMGFDGMYSGCVLITLAGVIVLAGVWKSMPRA